MILFYYIYDISYDLKDIAWIFNKEYFSLF